VVDFDVNNIHTCLRLRVTIPAIPRARLAHNIAQAFNRDTAPFATWRETGPAGTPELKEQCLVSSVLGPDHMRTHLAAMISVSRNNLILVKDRLTDNGIHVCHLLSTLYSNT
jgi:hypothetical protein